jgi:acid stress chaperone HdeB
MAMTTPVCLTGSPGRQGFRVTPTSSNVYWSARRCAFRGTDMTKPMISMLSLISFFLITSAAQAQVAIDVSKITCQQFRSYAITDPNNIALWLSGYYNGQRNNTIINVESFKENLEKVKDYCITHPTVTVMQTVEAVLGISK